MTAAEQTLTQSPTRQPGSQIVSGLLQRKCDCGQHTVAGGECDACGKQRLQRREANHAGSPEVPPMVNEVLSSPGHPIDAATRAFMEPRLGHDFAQVRIHTDARAAESAAALRARAYTVGSSVVFAGGQYAPGTATGKALLAHELVHVVQQSAAAPAGLFAASAVDSAEEHEAATVASQALGGRADLPQVQSRTPIQLARQPDDPTAPAGPASPTQVELIRVSCESNTIEFETNAGVYVYGLVDCDIEDADYMAEVTVDGNNVNFSGPPNGGTARFPYRISPGQPNPSTFFPNQTTVHIVTGTLSPTPGPVPGPPSPGPGAKVKVCSRDLQISPVGKHS